MTAPERSGIAVSRPVSASQAPEVPVERSTVQDDWRAALAAQLRPELSEWEVFIAGDGERAIGKREQPRTAEEVADALLPTVAHLVAVELHLAASVVAHTPGIKHQAKAVDALNARADRLDATPDHGKA